MPGPQKLLHIAFLITFSIYSGVWLKLFTNTADTFCEVSVVGVRIDTTDQTQALVLFCEKEKKYLFIAIATQEAIAIQLEMSGLKAPRPLTIDLLKNVLDELGATVTQCVITRVENEIFYAEIRFLNRDRKIMTIDARSSDAIGLALRSKIPIEVSVKVIQDYGISSPVPRTSKNKKS